MTVLPSIKLFKPSSLGTQDYWSTFYQSESRYIAENDDVMEIWYATAVRVVLDIITTLNLLPDCQILDVGTGNGEFLINLHDMDFTQLSGTDYVKESVDLTLKRMKDSSIPAKVYLDDITDSQLTKSSTTLYMTRELSMLYCFQDH
ncbi:hypothetical protein GEMRC1_006389 [Eukaryota sp. GEM-RC1]